VSDPVVMYRAGKAIEVPAEQVQDALDQGMTVEAPEQHAARITEDQREEEFGGVKGKVVGGLLAVARGASGGLSDVGIAALGGADSTRAYREVNPNVSTVGEIAGSLSELGVGGLAGNARKSIGGIAGYGAEGAILGLQPGVTELALSDDPLTAERISSVLSSSALLGGGIGAGVGTIGRLAEKGIARAGAAIEEHAGARAALDAIPADLAGLDAKGLRAAAAEERAALKEAARAERSSLEELRKPQREELANQIRDMHHELSTERPIFSAVVGDDVRAVEGVKDIASQLNKSYRGLRSTLDNPIRVAENPEVVLGHLQMRQTALESLQAKTPEILSVIGGDGRAAALEHVDRALEQTRAQIGAIKQLSRSNPVASARLSAIEAGSSPRLAQIEAAQDALTNAPKTGLIQKGLQSAAFTGGTALAHAIPGVGIMAPYVGKYASEAVGKVFEHLAGAGKAVETRTKQALDAFLNVGAKIPAASAVTATNVLSAARFAPSSPDKTPAPKGKPLVAAYRARSAEIRSQTMYDPTGQVAIRPEARQAIAQRLAPIAQVNPLLADKLETIAVRKAEHISATMPRQPDAGGLQIGPDNWEPSDLAMRSWARTVRAVEDPASVEEDLTHGILTPEAATAYRTVYPERFLAMQSAIFQAAPQLSKTLPMRRKIALSIFTGVPLIPALQPNILAVLQASFASEPGTAGGAAAPKPQPAFTAFGSTPSKDKTAAQRSDEP
jgi:hypothetical protein